MIEASSEDQRKLYETRPVLRKYTLIEGKTTRQLITQAISEVQQLYDERVVQTDLSTDPSLRDQLIKQIVAEITLKNMVGGVIIPRVLAGGRYELAEVMRKATCCIDAAVFAREVLKSFSIGSKIKRTNVGLLPNNHYLAINSGGVISPFLGTRKNKGFFKNEEEFQKRVKRLSRLSGEGLGLLPIKTLILKTIRAEK